MILTTVEALKIVKGICDLERRLPREHQSPAIAREARLTADVLIERSQQERATANWLRGK
jgi:hypothetical protein